MILPIFLLEINISILKVYQLCRGAAYEGRILKISVFLDVFIDEKFSTQKFSSIKTLMKTLISQIRPPCAALRHN